MNLTALKSWVSGETLTAADLNAEFQNIYTHTINNSDIDSTTSYVLGELVIGTGLAAADGGQLHVHTGSAGTVQAASDADEAVFENSTASGITILSGASSTGKIAFGDAGDNDIGLITYNHATNAFTLGTNGTTALTLSSAQAATFAGDVNVGGALTLTGGISLNGNTTIGNSASDTLTVTATVTSNLIFTDNTYDIGASGATRPRDLHLSRNALMGGTLGVTGLLTATAGVTSGSNIVSDTDGTDDLGLTGTRWRYVYADDIAITNDLAVTEGGTGASTSSAARTNLGVAIGSDVQAYDAGLADIAALATTDGNIIVGSGSNWVAESGATARTSLGLGTIATQDANNVTITGGSITGMGAIGGTTGTFSGNVTISKDAPYLIMTDSGTGGGTSKIAVDAVGSNHGFYFQADGSTNHVILESNGDFKVDADVLFVDANANAVGFNNASPEIAVDSKRNDSTAYSATSDQRGRALIAGRNIDQTTSAFSAFSFVSGAGTQAEWSINNVRTGDYVGDLAFKTRTGASTWAEAVRIKSTGMGVLCSPSAPLAVASKASSYEGMELVTPSGDGSGVFQFGVHDSGGSAGRSVEFRRGGSDGFDTLSARINADGNFSIGGDAVTNGTGSAVLNVNATTGGSTIHLTNNTTGTTNSDGALLVQSGSDLLFINRESGNLKLRTADTDRVTVLSDGKTGIGTSSPRYNFAVKGDNATAVGIALDNDSGGGALDISALGASYGAHGAAAGEIWFYSPDNINIGGATGNTNDIKFLGAGAEIARFTSDGDLLIGETSDQIARDYVTTGTSGDFAGYFKNTVSNRGPLFLENTNASLDDRMLSMSASAAYSGSTPFSFMVCTSSIASSADTEFNMRGDGEAYADGAWNNSGADYQEYFESASGEAAEVGRAIVLDSDKVRYYNADTDSTDDIMGVTRPQADNKNSAVVGNVAWNHWTDKYLTDDWGVYLREDVTVWTYTDEKGDEHTVHERAEIAKDANWVPPSGATASTQSVRKLNPDFNESLDENYESREVRDEWWLIGLLGQIQVKAGEPVNPRWIKMKNISDAVELYYVR